MTGYRGKSVAVTTKNRPKLVGRPKTCDRALICTVNDRGFYKTICTPVTESREVIEARAKAIRWVRENQKIYYPILGKHLEAEAA